MLKVFIENLSKRNEGELIGRWFDLEDYDGCDDMKEQGCFELIGVADGTDCEEWIVTDYDTDMPIEFSEYPDLDSFCELASDWADLCDLDRFACEAWLDYRVSDTLADAIDGISGDEVTVYPTCADAEDVMHVWHSEGLILCDLSDEYERFIDWSSVAEEYDDGLWGYCGCMVYFKN